MRTHSIPRQARDGEQSRTILTLAIIALLAGTAAEAKYSGGTGEPNDPYRIATKQDLLDLAGTTADYGKCFILTADIDLDPNLPGGQVFTTAIIAPNTDNSNYHFDGTAFTGTFDGNSHKITHFTVNGGSNWYLGLFGHINPGGSLKNLGLENCTVSGYQWVGGLVGVNYYSSISNCYSTGLVSGSQWVGGLVGDNYNGTITNCYSTGVVSTSSGSQFVGGLTGYNAGSISNCYSRDTVSGTSYVGGLAGNNHEGIISDCNSTGAVSGASNSEYVGGLVGGNGYGSISNCHSTGNVSGLSNSCYVGGLVGSNSYGSICNCPSTGLVSGSQRVGGLVGENYVNGSISDCYSTGAVSGTSYYVGGLVGCNIEGAITNCFSSGSVIGDDYVGGLMGYNYGSVSSSFWDTQTSGQSTSAGGEGKTTAEIKTMNAFVEAGWDFVEIWGIGKNQTYPHLRHDKKVDFKDLAILALHWLEGTGP